LPKECFRHKGVLRDEPFLHFISFILDASGRGTVFRFLQQIARLHLEGREVRKPLPRLDNDTQQITIFAELGRLATQNKPPCVILRSEAEPALSEAEGKNLIFTWKNETLRGVYPERRRRAQGDNCDLLILASIFDSWSRFL